MMRIAWTTLTTDSYVRLFDHGVTAFVPLASDDPDLAAFHAAGGKLVMWAGLADPLIPPLGSVHYYNEVTRRSGGLPQTTSYARLFLAPGVGHCGPTGSVGPLPVDPLSTVTTWAEHGVARQRMPASRSLPDGTVETRPLCAYPLVARYTGHGSTHDPANFRCAEVSN
jgi:feruloyl esterase